MNAVLKPQDLVFECEEPEKDSAFIVNRERWEDGKRIILEWRYPAEIGETSAVKENALRLARQLRDTCSDEDCDVSLILLGELLTLAGIELTPDEWKEFI
jgi:hypothetical protein